MSILIVYYLIAAACADKLGYNHLATANEDAEKDIIDLSSDAAEEGLPRVAPTVSTEPESSGLDVANGYDNATDLALTAAYADAQQVDFDKEFYTFTANDDDFRDAAADAEIGNQFAQILPVILLYERSELDVAFTALNKQADEENTETYVLIRQSDVIKLAHQLTADRDIDKEKLVKYQTPSDAANGLGDIPPQPESLGNTTLTHKDDVSIALNVTSKATV